MGAAVSYELLAAKFGDSGFTPEGGMYETFINNTGSSAKGTIVVASTAINNAVEIAPAGSQMPIGIIYENGVANGFPVKVVVYGKAQVLLKDGQNANNGYWCGVSDVAGRMNQSISVPVLALDYNTEIGHSLELQSSGTDVLALIQVHFN